MGSRGTPSKRRASTVLETCRSWRASFLPQLRSLLAILTVLIVVYGFGGSFSFIYVVTEGGSGTSTTTLPYLGYADVFTDFDFGVGAAIAVISMVVVGLLALGYLRASGREERTT